MHTLAKKFMMARKLDFGENGEAELLDDKVFLMDGSMLSSIAKNCDEETSYSIGKETGENLAKNIKKTGISGSKMIKFMMDLLTMMGIGKCEFNEFDIKKKEGEISVKNSIIHRKSKDGDISCEVLSGLIAGIVNYCYDKSFVAEEIDCNLGDSKHCKFEFRPEG